MAIIWNPTIQTSFLQLHINKSINQPGKNAQVKRRKKKHCESQNRGGWLSKNTLPIMPSYYRLIAFAMGLNSF